MGQEWVNGATEQTSDRIPILGKARLAILSLILLGFLIPSIASGAGCGNVPTAANSLVAFCIPLNVVNTQASGTVGNFVQAFNSLPFNALGGNFIVYNGAATSASNAFIPAWIESSSQFWVNFKANSIAASSSANGIYYLGFCNSCNFLITGNDIGEAPNLSSTYAKYDNGNIVFPFYDNFSGTSLRPRWTSTAAGVSVSNGLTVTASGGQTACGTAPNIYATSYTVGAGNIIEFYGNTMATGKTGINNEGYVGFGNSITNWCPSTGLGNFGYSGSAHVGLIAESAAGSTTSSTYSIVNSSIFGLNLTSGTTNAYQSYALKASLASTVSGSLIPEVVLGNTGYTVGPIYWWRVRPNPPNGVMPTVTYGSIAYTSGAAIPTLSISPNPALINQSITINAICTPSGDTCNIDYPTLGTVLATGTGSATYTYNAATLSSGTHASYYAADSTADLNSSAQNITIIFSQIYLQSSTTRPAYTFPITTDACTGNFLGGFCIGNDVISGTQTLLNNLFVKGNITVSPGAILSSNGFSILTSGTFNELGATITTPNVIGGGAGGITNAIAGTSVIQSYGGSGGGGGAGALGGGQTKGAVGGNTIAAGGTITGGAGNAGSTPSSPIVSNANIILWFDNGMQNYLAGAGGGGGGGSGSVAGTNGGNGAYGIYIQGNKLVIGTINAIGQGSLSGSYGTGGGGGGGIVLLANGIGGYVSGTINIAGGGAGTGGDNNGGGGGSGNTITYGYSTVPISIQPTATYPFMLYTLNSLVTYTLNSVVGATQTTLQGPTNTINFVPPSNQLTGIYNYSIIESNAVNTAIASIGLTVTMTDVGSALTFTGICGNVIQYFPNCALAPSWNAKPTSWSIKSDVAANNHVNSTATGNNIDQFSNANKTFTPNVILTYLQFSPNVIFSANLINNPSITSITQLPFNTITSNTVPAAPTTREFLSLVTENEQTLAKINTSSTVSFTLLFNNYTINNQTSITGTNTFATYIDNSVYQNPSFYISTLITSSTNTSYFPASNNFCPGFINSTTPQKNLFLYLVAYAVGQATTVDLESNFGGANNGDFMQILSGVNPTYATVVQQVLISTQNFIVPLIIGNSYSAKIVSGNCQTIYQTQAAAQSNPWYINIQGTVPPPQTVPQVNASCSLAFNMTFNANTITCVGTDNENLVDKWNVSIYNSSGFAGPHLITSNTINGGSFRWQYYPVYAIWGPLTWKIIWLYGTPDGSGSASGILNNILTGGYQLPLDTLLVVVFLIVGIVLGNATGGQGGTNHKLSNTLFIEAFMVFLMYMLGITKWLGWPFNTAIIVFLVIIGILGQRAEGSPFTGG